MSESERGTQKFFQRPKGCSPFFSYLPPFSSSLSGTLHEDEEVAEVYAAARSRESRYSGGARAECRGSLCACAAKSDGVFMKLIDSHLIATLHLSLSLSLTLPLVFVESRAGARASERLKLLYANKRKTEDNKGSARERELDGI